jgi:hypothetical protein
VDLEQAIAVINTAISVQAERTLSEVEIALLQGAWHGETYDPVTQWATCKMTLIQSSGNC